MRLVYLDHSATTPTDPAVVDAMRPYFTATFGNASSVHRWGREARAALETSRDTIAAYLHARNDEIFFTSGGTESDNHAIRGVIEANAASGKNHVVTTAVEHHAVLHTLESLRTKGVELTVVGVDQNGVVEPERVKAAFTPRTCLVSVMHVNNEVGTVEPVEEVSASARERGIPVHSDAVQSVGKIEVDVEKLGADLLSLSAHKVYGPKGIGALYIRKGTRVESFVRGGAQEGNRRAGTENVALAVGFAKAIELCRERREQDALKIGQLRSYLRNRIASSFDGVIFNGHAENSIPNVLSISFDSRMHAVDGEALIMGMDLHGVAVTSGSACTSGSLQPSHVLQAIGRDEMTARATIRFSLGRGTTQEDLDYAVEALREVLKSATLSHPAGIA